jgi:hypothetical protein
LRRRSVVRIPMMRMISKRSNSKSGLHLIATGLCYRGYDSMNFRFTSAFLSCSRRSVVLIRPSVPIFQVTPLITPVSHLIYQLCFSSKVFQ